MFGYVGKRDEAPQLVLAGLKKLEYRGYDSWGIASRQNGSVPAAPPGGETCRQNWRGKYQLAGRLRGPGPHTMGHTWRRHPGQRASPSRLPWPSGSIHNGIVENHEELRRALIERGHTFQSQTDTEVVAHLVEDELTGGQAQTLEDRLVGATMRAFRRLEGLSAISVLDRQDQCIAVAKNGSPMVLGYAADGNYLASDSAALLEHTRRLTFLEDGQAALITTQTIAVYDVATGDKEASPRIWDITWAEESADLGQFPELYGKGSANNRPSCAFLQHNEWTKRRSSQVHPRGFQRAPARLWFGCKRRTLGRIPLRPGSPAPDECCHCI